MQTAMWPLRFGRDCEIQRLRGPRCEGRRRFSPPRQRDQAGGVGHAPEPGTIHGCQLHLQT